MIVEHNGFVLQDQGQGLYAYRKAIGGDAFVVTIYDDPKTPLSDDAVRGMIDDEERFALANPRLPKVER